MKYDNGSLRAFLYLGKAYACLSKEQQALEAWNLSLVQCTKGNVIYDAGIVKEIQDLLQIYSLSPLESINKQVDRNMLIEQQEIIVDKKDTKINPETAADFDQARKIKILHDKTFVSNLIAVPPAVIKNIRANLAHTSGDVLVDEIIAYGYFQVNTGLLDEAIETFSELLKCRKDLCSAYLGIGSAYAMKREMDEAVSSFSAAIIIDPIIADAWKRRGQVYAAIGLFDKALTDLDQSINIDGSEADSYFQRALIYIGMNNFRRALEDLRIAEKKGLSSASLFYNIGVCEGQLGNIFSSIENYQKSHSLEPSREALLNSAQMYKEIGNWNLADSGFQEVIKLHASLKASGESKNFPLGHWYRAQLLYAIGRPKSALKEVMDAMNEAGESLTDNQWRIFAGTCWQAEGCFKQAVDCFDKAVVKDPYSYAWCLREVAISIWASLDRRLDSFNLDNEISPIVKDAWCKKSNLYFAHVEGYKKLIRPSNISAVVLEKTDVEEMRHHLEQLKNISSWIQLDCQGFLPNSRQHRMFGAAVVHCSLLIGRQAQAVSEGAPGIVVSDERSSTNCKLDTSIINKKYYSIGRRGKVHVLDWRDIMDIAVLWRQLSEPNDPVWWIDKFSKKAFEEGFGLQTPIVHGQLKTVRYYSYFEKAFAMLKELVIKNYYSRENVSKVLSEELKSHVSQASNLTELYKIVGEDFYVIIPYHSKYQQDVFEGTRLTLLKKDPDGFEFTIRTPGTPDRFKQFGKEMSCIFEK